MVLLRRAVKRWEAILIRLVHVRTGSDDCLHGNEIAVKRRVREVLELGIAQRTGDVRPPHARAPRLVRRLPLFQTCGAVQVARVVADRARDQAARDARGGDGDGDGDREAGGGGREEGRARRRGEERP